jgi:hypothetical protein
MMGSLRIRTFVAEKQRMGSVPEYSFDDCGQFGAEFKGSWSDYSALGEDWNGEFLQTAWRPEPATKINI